MSEGYIYCLSNECMPGILKVGMTERTPDVRAKELFTTGVPTPFIIEFAKKVKDVKTKEKKLHELLEEYTDRVGMNREFFRVSPEKVSMFFDLMDGEMWETTKEEEDVEEIVEAVDEITVQAPPSVNTTELKKTRNMAKCFTNGQRIRHTIVGINKTLNGTYDSSKNEIVCDDKSYDTLSGFAISHHRIYNPARKTANGWTECKCEVDGKWIFAAEFQC